MPGATDLPSRLLTQLEGAGQWLDYEVIFDFIDGEIRTFQDNTLDAVRGRKA